LDELLLLNALWLERELDNREASRLIQKPQTEARTTLASLIEAGLVEAHGKGTGRTYKLSAAVYRVLGKKAAYVRQQDFEPFQQEQMILRYVDEHGSISRSEVAELCRITDPQAYRLLQKLLQSGQLTSTGRRGRSTRYLRGTTT
jgi:ATP-dependent DNA helicase RecG